MKKDVKSAKFFSCATSVKTSPDLRGQQSGWVVIFERDPRNRAAGVILVNDSRRWNCELSSEKESSVPDGGVGNEFSRTTSDSNVCR